MNHLLLRQIWILGLCILALSFDARAADKPLTEPGNAHSADSSVVSSKSGNGEWEKISDDDGIEVFKKEIPGNPMVAFKGQGVVDATMLKVISVLSDVPRGVEWIDSLEDTLLLKKNSDTNWITYTHIGTPMVMKDRDFVIQSNIEIKPDNSIVMSLKSVDDPTAPKSSYVRGEIMDSSYVLTPQDGGKKTYVVTEIHADPKGSTAKWIVNMFQKKWPRNTLSSLRKQVAKTDIAESAYFKKALSTQNE